MRSSALAILLVVLQACATTIGPEAPPVFPVSPLNTKESSQLLVPLTIKREVLVKLADEYLPRTLAGEGSGTVDVWGGRLDYRFDYRLTRSAVSVEVSGRAFTISAALTGPIAAHSHGVDAVVDSRIVVTVSGDLSLGADWKLDPHLRGSYLVERAEIPIGFSLFGAHVGFVVNAKTALENSLRGPFANLMVETRAAVAALDVKEKIRPFWTLLGAPIELWPRPHSWLTIVPSAVSFSPDDIRDGDLHVSIGLKAQTEVVFGARPADAVLGELPDLSYAETAPGFRLRIPVKIPFEQLSSLAAEQAAGKTFTVEKGEVQVQSVAIRGNGRKLVVSVGFTATRQGVLDAQGTMHFTGNLVFDDALRQFRVTGFDFDARTSNALFNSAAWLLHGNLVEKGAASINAAFAEIGAAPLTELQDQLNARLSNLELRPGVVARGTLAPIGIVGIGNDAENLLVETQFSGDLNVLVDSL